MNSIPAHQRLLIYSVTCGPVLARLSVLNPYQFRLHGCWRLRPTILGQSRLRVIIHAAACINLF